MSIPLIGGQHGVVFFGPRRDPKRFRYWAERGLIHMEDASDNSYETFTVKEFVLRFKAINDMLGNSQADLRGFAHWDEVDRTQRFIEEAAALAMKAKEQGTPPRLFSGMLHRERFGATVRPKARHQFGY